MLRENDGIVRRDLVYKLISALNQAFEVCHQGSTELLCSLHELIGRLDLLVQHVSFA